MEAQVASRLGNGEVPAWVPHDQFEPSQRPCFERVVAEARSSFRCVRNTCNDLAADHPWHFHPEYELSWVVRSSGVRFVGDAAARYVPGEVVLYGPSLPHCSRNDLVGPDPAAEYITVQFNLSCFGAGFLDLPEASAISGLLGEAALAIIFAPAAAAAVGSRLQEMVELEGMLRLARLLEVLEILTAIPRRTMITANYLEEVIRPRAVDKLHEVKLYIGQRFRGYVSQAEIADQLGMSPAMFSKYIRRTTGQTFMTLVKFARISEACRMLAHSDDRITDIALECGYQHTSHFDRHFVEQKGIAPGEYRRRMQLLAGRDLSKC